MGRVKKQHPKQHLSDTVVSEGKDTFSAWPILFNRQPDLAGFRFGPESDLQPPFDNLLITFRFFLNTNPENLRRYKPVDVTIATVLRWRLTAEGLWIRGGYIEEPQPDPNNPILALTQKLKGEISKGRIGLTYYTVADRVFVGDDGIVEKMPIVAFTFYEIPELIDEPAEPEAEVS